MYIVIGNSPKKILLKDLNDCIYYKQQKAFTDAQYQHSSELRQAITRGFVIVVRRTEDKSASFNISSNDVIPEIKDVEIGPSKIDQLLERIKELEVNLGRQNQKAKETDSTILSTILKRLDNLEKKESTVDISVIKEALGNIEKKIQESKAQENKNDILVEKIQKIINTSIKEKTKEVIPKKKDNVITEERYIPNIRVEDAKSHINLQVRKIDSGDNVADSIKRLKELRSKSK